MPKCLKFTVELTEEQVRLMATSMGILSTEVTDLQLTNLLAQWLMERLTILKEQKNPRKIPASAIREQVLSECRAQQSNRGVRAGATDRELIEALPHCKESAVRWVRYKLVQDGELKAVGRRATGTVWAPIDWTPDTKIQDRTSNPAPKLADARSS